MAGETLQGPASFTLEARKSRFLAQGMPVETPEQAMAWLKAIADPQATHNCWAYRIGAQYRFSDDGEPSGTAGRPILAAIDGQGYDHVVVVVTRWYGGIKLGAGGLVRAYGGCAAECLRLAARTALIEQAEATIDYDFGDTGAVHAALAQFGADKLDEQFGAAGATLRLRLPSSALAPLKAQLRDATRDRVRVHGD